MGMYRLLTLLMQALESWVQLIQSVASHSPPSTAPGTKYRSTFLVPLTGSLSSCSAGSRTSRKGAHTRPSSGSEGYMSLLNTRASGRHTTQALETMAVTLKVNKSRTYQRHTLLKRLLYWKDCSSLIVEYKYFQDLYTILGLPEWGDTKQNNI